MPSYEAKNSLTQARQLKVQRLCIPFTIAGSATSANVVPLNDEPAMLFFASEGVNQITAALATNETATYTTAAADATGITQFLLRIGEDVAKVCSVYAVRRNSAELIPGLLGSATGITTGTAGGQSIMGVIDSSLSLAAANTLNACLVVEYVASSGN